MLTEEEIRELALESMFRANNTAAVARLGRHIIAGIYVRPLSEGGFELHAVDIGSRIAVIASDDQATVNAAIGVYLAS